MKMILKFVVLFLIAAALLHHFVPALKAEHWLLVLLGVALLSFKK